MGGTILIRFEVLTKRLPTGFRVKIGYDEDSDTMHITFRETPVTEQQVADGVALEVDSDGQLAGIEILDAVRRFGNGDTLQQVVLEIVKDPRR